MTLQEYINQVRRVLDEYDTDISFWTDEELTFWLNEGLKEVSKIAKHLTEIVYINPADDDGYVLPYNYIDWFKVKLDDKFLGEISIEEDCKKQGFYIWGDNIYLSKLDDDSQITLYYYRTANKMSTMLDEAELPTQYEEIIIPFCLYRAFMKDQRADVAQLNQREFMERVRVMKKRYNNEPIRTSWKVERR